MRKVESEACFRGLVAQQANALIVRWDSGREGYGKRDKRAREEEFPRPREPGELEKTFATLRYSLL